MKEKSEVIKDWLQEEGIDLSSLSEETLEDVAEQVESTTDSEEEAN